MYLYVDVYRAVNVLENGGCWCAKKPSSTIKTKDTTTCTVFVLVVCN